MCRFDHSAPRTPTGYDTVTCTAGCIAGALSRAEYLDGLAAAGFAEASVTFTAEAAQGLHSATTRGQPATA